MNAKKQLSRKALFFVSLLVMSSLILSACGAPTADPNVVAVSLTQTKAAELDMTQGEAACNGKIGVTDDGKWECAGVTYAPLPSEVGACQASNKPEKVWVTGDNGEPFEATCEIILANAKTVAVATATGTTVPTDKTEKLPTKTPMPLPIASQYAVLSGCNFSEPGPLDTMEKTTIELFQLGQWTHRVHNVRDFHAPDWNGADSWFVTLAVGPTLGTGAWTSYGNPGEIIYRATSTSVSWCLGVLTTSQYKSQFMSQGDSGLPLAINVRITPETKVHVHNAVSDVYFTQETSDGGDITIILPDDGVVTIWADVTTNAPTFESRIHWGAYDRSENINTIDTR